MQIIIFCISLVSQGAKPCQFVLGCTSCPLNSRGPAQLLHPAADVKIKSGLQSTRPIVSQPIVSNQLFQSCGGAVDLLRIQLTDLHQLRLLIEDDEASRHRPLPGFPEQQGVQCSIPPHPIESCLREPEDKGTGSLRLQLLQGALKSIGTSEPVAPLIATHIRIRTEAPLLPGCCQALQGNDKPTGARREGCLQRVHAVIQVLHLLVDQDDTPQRFS